MGSLSQVSQDTFSGSTISGSTFSGPTISAAEVEALVTADFSEGFGWTPSSPRDKPARLRLIHHVLSGTVESFAAEVPTFEHSARFSVSFIPPKSQIALARRRFFLFHAGEDLNLTLRYLQAMCAQTYGRLAYASYRGQMAERLSITRKMLDLAVLNSLIPDAPAQDLPRRA